MAEGLGLMAEGLGLVIEGFKVQGSRFRNLGLACRVRCLKFGGVNHRRSHCRLAKFLGLMYRGKYSAVIGVTEPTAWRCMLGTRKKNVSRPIIALYTPPYIRPQKFDKRQSDSVSDSG